MMGKERVQVLGWAAGSLLLIGASAFVLDWFGAEHGGPRIDSLAIDLRSLEACTTHGRCASQPVRALGGAYPAAAWLAWWGSLAMMASVAWATVVRIRGGIASARLARVGYGVGIACGLAATIAGYVVGPESVTAFAVTVQRTWAPMMMLLGDAGAVIAIYVAASPELSVLPVATARPPASVSTGRAVGTRELDAAETARASSAGQGSGATTAPDGSAAPAVKGPLPTRRARALSAPFPPASVPMLPVVRLPAAERAASTAHGRLRFGVISVDLGEVGVEAHREDGGATLVAWADIVGVVARRLPPEPPYDGVAFVDVVSTEGATLRVLPWTALTGADLDGGADARARAFARLLAARCPAAKIDAATRRFINGHDAAQLPDARMLAAHDQRLS
jgi:hypothetical protein